MIGYVAQPVRVIVAIRLLHLLIKIFYVVKSTCFVTENICVYVYTVIQLLLESHIV